MKIALLSHRGGNIGHDFMAVGMNHILRQEFGKEVEIVEFEQHRHFEVNPSWHPVRLMHLARHGKMRTLRRFLASDSVRKTLWTQTRPLDFHLAVAAGGPNVVRNVVVAPEMALMMLYMNGAFHHHGVPLVDAGVGSAFPLESADARLISRADREFYREAASYCTRITVRESVAQKTFADIDVDAELIPCGAIACGRVMQQLAKDEPVGRYVLFNFQAAGANDDWGQGVDRQTWLATVRAVVRQIEQSHPVVFVAHSAREAQDAKKIGENIVVVQPSSLEEYARVAMGAKAALVSRIHAAVPLAGMGIPSLVIGTDTRIGTAATIGLPTMYVKEATVEGMLGTLDDLIRRRVEEAERLRVVGDEAIRKYGEVFRAAAKA